MDKESDDLTSYNAGFVWEGGNLRISQLQEHEKIVSPSDFLCDYELSDDNHPKHADKLTDFWRRYHDFL